MDGELLTFGEMKTQVGRECGDTSTSRVAYIGSKINDHLRRASQAMPWPQLMAFDEVGGRINDASIKSFVSGDAHYPAPFGLDRLCMLRYQDADREVRIVDQETLFRRAGANPNTSGRPQLAAKVGQSALIQPLAADGVVTFQAVVKTNANEDIDVAYERASSPVGFETRENVDSVDWVTVRGTISDDARAGYSVRRVDLPSTFVGTLKAYGDFGGAGQKLLGVYEQGSTPNASTETDRRRVFSGDLYRLWPVPDQDYAMTVGYIPKQQPLVADEDMPRIPVTHFLMAAAAADVLLVMGHAQRAGARAAQAEQFLAQMVQSEVPDESPGVHDHPYGYGDFCEQSGVDGYYNW